MSRPEDGAQLPSVARVVRVTLGRLTGSRPRTLTGLAIVIVTLRDQIEVWVNEGGAGGEDGAESGQP